MSNFILDGELSRDAMIKFGGAPYHINNGNVLMFDRSIDSSEKINRGNKTGKYCC